jgi:hypothetical protein
MKAITQNKIGTITLEESVIRDSISNYVNFNKSYKLIDLHVRQNEVNRFIFILTFSTASYKTIVTDLDALTSHIQKQIEKNLQLFGSTIIAKISE